MPSKITLNDNSQLWNVSLTTFYAQIQTDCNSGLIESEVSKGIKRYGLNTPPDLKAINQLQIFIAQFTDPLIIILIFVSIFSFFVGESLNGGIILGMLLFNSVIGFYQEKKAAKSVVALRNIVSFNARVFRDGIYKEIDNKELVPGDLVQINMGDIIPADIRLIQVNNLHVNESVLTGESLPVEKIACDTADYPELPQKMKNVCFSGSAVVSGSAKGIVFGTGQNTVLFRSTNFNDVDHKTNFEKKLEQFSRYLLIGVVALTIFVLVSNYIMGRGLVDSILLAVTLALGITPEILPIIVTLTISTSVLRLSKEGVIVRRLDALEDLGNVDVICTDKTGTITEGILKLMGAYDEYGKVSNETLLYSLICNAYNPATNNQIFKSTLDKDLWTNANKELKVKAQEVEIISWKDFDFDKKYMEIEFRARKGISKNATETQNEAQNDKTIKIIKGATEAILELCKECEGKRKEISEIVHKLEDQGSRIISVAIAEGNGAFEFSGTVLFKDPPKKSLNLVIENLAKLSVKLKVITGDSAEITRTICESAGIEVHEKRVILGEELFSLSNSELHDYVKRFNIFARVSPEQKSLIINTLRKSGHVVAYIGDGINDVGALLNADVGIAVKSARDVTKDSADIILMKNDLNILADGIKEGRKTFGNTTKFIINTMSSSFGNVLSLAVVANFMKFVPLLPAQLLLIDTLSDVQHLSMATDNVDEEEMRKPKNWDMKFLVRFMVFFGLLSSITDFVFIYFILQSNPSPELFRTMWFLIASVEEILATFSIRTKKMFFKSKPSFTLVLTSLLTIIASVLITVIVFVPNIFGFIRLNIEQYFVVAFVITLYIIPLEIAKLLFYRYLNKNKP